MDTFPSYFINRMLLYLISFVKGLFPRVSEAHCGYISLHEYHIPTTYRKDTEPFISCFNVLTSNTSFQYLCYQFRSLRNLRIDIKDRLEFNSMANSISLQSTATYILYQK